MVGRQSLHQDRDRSRLPPIQVLSCDSDSETVPHRSHHRKSASMTRISRTRRTFASVFCIVVGCGAAIHADIKTEQKGQVKFAGGLGRMFNMFGGKAAREGVVSKVAVKGDRMLTSSGETGQLVDLAEEKVYDINFEDKSYKVTTFEELRRRMREAEEKARQERANAEKKEEEKAAESGEKPPEYEVEVVTKSTGATKTINGFDAKQSIT